ncbi:hypothetical protein ACVWXM_006411 [Bradyrhizobium sp. GM7.3]
MLEPLAIFELTQLVGDADEHIGIRADPKGTAGTDEFASRENAVAKACLGDRAEAGDRAGPSEGADFLVRGVGGVNEAPALIDGCVLQQPLHRTSSGPRQAILDFLHLLGGMNVHRAALREWNDSRKLGRRYGAQAVRRDADICARQSFNDLARGSHQCGKLINRTDEAALAAMRCCASK